MKRQFRRCPSMLQFRTMPHWGRGYGFLTPLRALKCNQSLHPTGTAKNHHLPSNLPKVRTFQTTSSGGYGVYDFEYHLNFQIFKRVNGITTQL